mgnify:CR=1 FL=1
MADATQRKIIEPAQAVRHSFTLTDNETGDSWELPTLPGFLVGFHISPTPVHPMNEAGQHQRWLVSSALARSPVRWQAASSHRP